MSHQHSCPRPGGHIYHSHSGRPKPQFSTASVMSNGFVPSMTPLRPQIAEYMSHRDLQSPKSFGFELSSIVNGEVTDDDDNLPIRLPPQPMMFEDEENLTRKFVPITKLKPALRNFDDATSESETEADAFDGELEASMITPPVQPLEIGSPPTPISPSTPPPFGQLATSAPSCRKLARQMSYLGLQRNPCTPQKPSVPKWHFRDEDNFDTVSSPIFHLSQPSLMPKKQQPMKRLMDTESMTESDQDDNHRRRRTSLLDTPSRTSLKGSTNVARFKQEFIPCGILGHGEFGTVYKCQHRLDGAYYAIKRSNNPIAGLSDEKRLKREVNAHAEIKVQPHIVRYFSAWEEEDHMLIQSELCNGGSLEDEIRRRAKGLEYFTEDELKEILRQIATGLHSMHSQYFAHLDIKPGNILLHKSLEATSPQRSSSHRLEAGPFSELSMRQNMLSDSAVTVDCTLNDSVLADSMLTTPVASPSRTSSHQTPQQAPANQNIISSTTLYKIGDLGHATRIDGDTSHIEDGDARYLAPELLDNNYDALSKADMFSLGLTLVEAATLLPLPKNGTEWHDLRSGVSPTLGTYSHAFHSLVWSMIHPDAAFRPTAEDIIHHSIFIKNECPLDEKSRDQLRQELLAEKAEKLFLQIELKSLKEMSVQHQDTAFSPLASNCKQVCPSFVPRIVHVKQPKVKFARAASVPGFL